MKEEFSMKKINRWLIGVLLFGAVFIETNGWMQPETVNAVQSSRRFRVEAYATYATITYERYTLFEELDAEVDGRETNGEKLNQTYRVDQRYTRGIESYLHLVDNEGASVGYISESSVTVSEEPEGVKQPLVQTMTIKRSGYPIYPDLKKGFKEKTGRYINESVKITGAYHTFSGQTFYEVSTEQENFLGYIEQDAFKEPIKKKQTKRTVKKNKKTTTQKKTTTTETMEEKTVEQTTKPVEAATTFSGLSSPYLIGGTIPPVQNNFLTESPIANKKIAYSNQTQQEFIDLLVPHAQELGKEYDLFPSLMIAQAALESAYGQSQLSTEANNLFGIKYSGYSSNSEIGKYEIPSDEFVNGKQVTLPATFRKYPTIRASLEDYAKLLANGLNYSPRFYAGSWRSQAGNYQTAARALTGKYATDPSYGEKLIQVIQNWNLAQYD